MYLDRLNEEEAKEFLELSYYAANYNNKFADEQKLLIDEYRVELLLPKDEYKIQEKDLNDILSKFKNSDEEIKKVVFLEIMALILSDNIYDEKEREIISKIGETLGITREEHDFARDWVNNMQDLYISSEKFIQS